MADQQEEKCFARMMSYLDPQPMISQKFNCEEFKSIYKGCKNDLYKDQLNALLHEAIEKITWPTMRGTAKNPVHEIIAFLIEIGADVNQPVGKKFPITRAHNAEIIRILLESGADPNVTGKEGSPLLCAVRREDTASVKLLLESGADPNATDEDGRTPLMFVSEAKSVRTFKKFGANFSARDKQGKTILWHALQSHWRKPETIAALIKAGALVNETDRAGNGVLTYPPNADHVEALLNNGALPNHQNKKGVSPLMHWAGEGLGKRWYIDRLNAASRKACLHLLKFGADIDATDGDGLDALMHASKAHNDGVIKLLLQKKADPLRASNNGWTCLEWSLDRDQNPSQKMIDALLDGGANINGDPKLGTARKNLLGRFLQVKEYPYCFRLIARGAMIGRVTLATIGITPSALLMELEKNGDGTEAAKQVNNLASLCRLDPNAFRNAIDPHDYEVSQALEKLLVMEEAANQHPNNTLQQLEARNWPPSFQKRQKIVVEGLATPHAEPYLAFTELQAAEYTAKGSYSYKENKSDAEIIDLITRKTQSQKKIAFTDLLKASDQALLGLWNGPASENWELFYLKGYYSGRGARISGPEMKYILARCGIAAIPGMLIVARDRPDMMCKVLAPASDARLASLMASRLFGTAVSSQARNWLVRHPDAAISGLIPIAVGLLGPQRESGEAALRYLSAQGFTAKIERTVAKLGKDAVESVKEILSTNRCADYLRKPLVEIPAGLFGDNTTRPTIKDSNQPIPDSYLPALFGMMSVSSCDDVYPDLVRVKALFDPGSMANFAWSVFVFWNALDNYSSAEKKIKKNTEWAFHCLAYLRNHRTVSALASRIQSWPKEQGMAKAVIGLDILACMGTDAAIRAINAILLKTKYKLLLKRAAEILETVADARSLTLAQLDDRLVPLLDLGADSTLMLDFGARTFRVHLDEKLKASLVGSEGKTIKALPRAAKADDRKKVQEATAAWKEFGFALRKEAPTQLLRLERAMIEERRWSGAEFRTLLAGHPLLRPIVMSLVWAEYDSRKPIQTFRVRDDGIFVSCRDERVEIGDTALIGIPHPLAFKAQLKDWTEHMVQNKIKQSFPQVIRQTFERKNDSKADLFGIQGGKAPDKAFRGLKKKGWAPDIGDAGGISEFEKILSRGTVRLGFDGVVSIYDDGTDDEQTLEVTLPEKLSPIEFSEVVRELKELLH